MSSAEMKSRMRSLNHQALLHNIHSLHPLYPEISHFFVDWQRSAVPEAAHLSINARSLLLLCFVELKWMIQWSLTMSLEKCRTFLVVETGI